MRPFSKLSVQPGDRVRFKGPKGFPEDLQVTSIKVTQMEAMSVLEIRTEHALWIGPSADTEGMGSWAREDDFIAEQLLAEFIDNS